MADAILADLATQSAHSLTGAFALLPGLTANVTIGSTGSVVLLKMIVNPDVTDADDDCGEYVFTVDGDSTNSPNLTSLKDNVDQGSSRSMYWALSGFAGGSSHTFEVHGRNRSGAVDLSTVRDRIFQIVEIENASIVIDLTLTSAGSSPTSWADMPGMFASIAVTADSAHILLANVQQELTSTDDGAEIQFAIDDVRDGPALHCQSDQVDEGDGVALSWVKIGLTGTVKFALQWQTRQGTTDLDTSRVRTFQVIQRTANFNLLVDIESISADTAPSPDGTFAAVDEMDAAPISDGTDSIHLKFFNMQCARTGGGGDVTTEIQMGAGASRDGAPLLSFGDASGRFPGQSNFHAETGIAGAFTLEGQWSQHDSPNDDATTNTTFERTLQDLELTAAGIPDVTGSGACVAPAHDVQGTGELVIEGAGACIAPAHDVQGTGEIVIEGAGACVAPAHDVQGTGELVIEGAGACVAPAHDVEGDGLFVVTVTGSGACVAPAHDVQGTGELVIEGAGACTAPAHDVQGTGEFTSIVTGAGACVAPAHDVQGTGELVIEGAGACVAPAHDVQGIGAFLEDLPPIPDVEVVKPACPFLELTDTHSTSGDFVEDTLEITRGTDVVSRAVRPCDPTLVFTRPA